MNGTRNRPTIRPDEQIALFWSKVDRTGGPDACWPWTASVNRVTGYGAFHPSRTSGYPHTVSAHRFAAHLAGVITLSDPDQNVDHECHNNTGCPPGPCPHRLCCNPSHHRARTSAENVAASHNSNGRKTHCPHGHEYTPANTRFQVRGKTTLRKCIACEKVRESTRRRAK